MKTLKAYLSLLTIVAAGALAGCSTKTAQTKAPDVTASIRSSLDQAGLKDVTATQDRDKGVVTLGGHVASDSDKAQAASLTQSLAGGQVIANEIAVTPAGSESEAKKVTADLDKGIESNLDAALLAGKLHERVKYASKNGVVTLTGSVDSEAKRAAAQQIASTVPNVQQVVNELQVKGQKATSSN